jgi:phage replication O-like protein O
MQDEIDRPTQKEFKKGYTRIPNRLFNAILIAPYNKRQIKIILLIVRLTYGCGKGSVALKQADLSSIGIDETHAKEALQPLIANQILSRNETTHKVRINYDDLINNIFKDNQKKLNKLQALIGKNLVKSDYSNGNKKATKIVSYSLPRKQNETNQISKERDLPKEKDYRRRNIGFVSTKEIIKERIK